jgi:hypothetical protein
LIDEAASKKFSNLVNHRILFLQESHRLVAVTFGRGRIQLVPTHRVSPAVNFSERPLSFSILNSKAS